MNEYYEYSCVLGTQLAYIDNLTEQMWVETGFGWQAREFDKSEYKKISKKEFLKIKEEKEW